MFRELLKYFPLGPLAAALLLFALIPFDKAPSRSGDSEARATGGPPGAAASDVRDP